VAVDLVDGERNLPLLLWKLCSAVSHGDTWVLTTFDLERLLWSGVKAATTMIVLVHQKFAMQVLVHR